MALNESGNAAREPVAMTTLLAVTRVWSATAIVWLFTKQA